MERPKDLAAKTIVLPKPAVPEKSAGPSLAAKTTISAPDGRPHPGAAAAASSSGGVTESNRARMMLARQKALREQHAPARKPAVTAPRVAARPQAIRHPADAERLVAGSPGESLPPEVQSALEESFGVSLQTVRVHQDATAQETARALSARAFTHGTHIFLGPGEQASDLKLMAHEAAHVVQQQGAPAIQRLGTHQSDKFESEAERASHAAVSRQQFSVQNRTERQRVQRFGLSDALDYIANKANLIPGFRMFTIILGVNPVNMSRVDRSAANILRALIEFIPGGALVTQALDNHGVFDKVGKWVEQQIQTLGMVGSSFKQALDKFLDSLSWTDILHPGDVWERAKRIFTEPIDRIINFAKGLITGIITFIKDAILLPLAKLAEGTRGWDLLIAVLGKNPITGVPVPRTAETLIGGFMKLIGQEEVWENMKKANAIARAWAWFQGTLSALLGFVSQIPTLAINAFKSLELVDIILVPKAFIKVGAVFGGFIVKFISWAGNAVWRLLEIIFEVVIPKAIPYLKKAAGAFRSILKNPIGFISNLVKAGKLGFENFAKNVGTHLKNSLIEWLTGSLAGVYIPKALELKEIVKFVLSVLGISWQNIRQKLVKVVGEPAVKAMETGFDLVVTLVAEGPAAAWDKIKEQLGNLKEMVMGAIINFVVETLVKKAVAKVISLLIPGGAFIQAIITIYDTIMVFIDKLQKIIAVATAFLDSIMAIAGGAIAGAAKKVEITLAGLLTLALSFLAGFAGLGKIADKVMEIINTKIRQPIDKALDFVINWIVTMAKKLFAKVFGKKDKPDERTEDRKKADLNSAVIEAEALLSDKSLHPNQVKTKLPVIQKKYKLTVLQLVKDMESSQSETDHIHAEINPVADGKKIEKPKAAGPLKGISVRTVPKEIREKLKHVEADPEKYELGAMSTVVKDVLIPDWEERTTVPITTGEPRRESAEYMARFKTQKAFRVGSRRPRPEGRVEIRKAGGKGAISHVFAVEVTTIRDLTDIKGSAVRHKLEQIPNTIETLVAKYGPEPEIEYTIICPRDLSEEETKIIEGLLDRPDAKKLKVVWVKTGN